MLQQSTVLRLLIYFCSLVNAAVDRSFNLDTERPAGNVSYGYFLPPDMDEFAEDWIQNSFPLNKTGHRGVNGTKITKESFNIGRSWKIMRSCLIEEKETLCLDIGKKSGEKQQYPIRIRIRNKIKPDPVTQSPVSQISRARRLKRGANGGFYDERFGDDEEDEEYNKGLRFMRDEEDEDEEDDGDDEMTIAIKRTTKGDDIDDDEDEDDNDDDKTTKVIKRETKDDDVDVDEDEVTKGTKDYSNDEEDNLRKKKGKNEYSDSKDDNNHDKKSNKKIGKKKKNHKNYDYNKLTKKKSNEQDDKSDDNDWPNKRKINRKHDDLVDDEDDDKTMKNSKREKNESDEGRTKSKKNKKRDLNVDENKDDKPQKKISEREDEDAGDDIDKLYKKRTKEGINGSEDEDDKLKQVKGKRKGSNSDDGDKPYKKKSKMKGKYPDDEDDDDKLKQAKHKMKERYSDEDDDEEKPNNKVHNFKNDDSVDDAADMEEDYGKPTWKRCVVPKPHKTTEALCKMMPHQLVCHLYCVFGHTYPEGIMRRTTCDFKIGKWTKEFTDCKPFVDCTLKLKREGYLKCFTNTVKDSPKCIVGCLEGSRSHSYRCDVEGQWKPELPHCVTLEGIELVEPPQTIIHSGISYPK